MSSSLIDVRSFSILGLKCFLFSRLYDISNFNKNQLCAFWNYETQKGSWEREKESKKSRCESKSLNYIAILEDENLNVTNTLENILESTASVRTKLRNVLAIVSENKHELRSIDIHLISKIMGKLYWHNYDECTDKICDIRLLILELRIILRCLE